MKLKHIAKNIVEHSYDSKLKRIHKKIKKLLNAYDRNNLDDVWVKLRSYDRYIDAYWEDGYFVSKTWDLTYFLKGLDYSETHTYTKDKRVGYLPNTNVPYYKARGNKVLFRGVSVADWKRIQANAYIDSDGRKAVVSGEGINLAQVPKTAMYYLPHDDAGVILAIDPSGLDLYMLNDEYIRVFHAIPIKNVIKVSDVIVKNKNGDVLDMNTEGIVSDIIDDLGVFVKKFSGAKN